jgi:small redox-active disulfide protein 2
VVRLRGKTLKEKTMIIKVLGTGCPNCLKLEASARIAAKELGLDAEIVKVTDIAEITAYGIMRTPGLVVDEKVVSYGKVLNPNEVKVLLEKVSTPGRLSGV